MNGSRVQTANRDEQLTGSAGPDFVAVRAVTATRPRRTVDYESIALVVGGIAFVAVVLVAPFAFWGRDMPIAGRGSAGEFAAIAGAIAAALGFAGARILVARSTRDPQERAVARYHWFDLVALSVAHGTIALLGWLGAATIFEYSFVGATLYPSPAVMIAAATTALSAYVAFLSGASLSPRQLSLVLAVFLVVGMVTAMLSASDPSWWELNLSALGMTHDTSSLAFNFTLIVSGVIVTTIARFGTAALPAATPQARSRRTTVRVMFVLLGVLLSCVGIFPVDRFFLLHNTVATGMAVVFAVLVLGTPWLMPSMRLAFVVLGYVFVAGIVGLALLFAIGVYNLTAVELVASALIFGWIILFLRNVGTARQARPVRGTASGS